MNTFLLAAAVAVVLIVLAGILRAVRGPARTDRLLAIQLLSSGSVGALLLLSSAGRQDGVLDIALLLAVLSPFGILGAYLGSRGSGRKSR